MIQKKTIRKLVEEKIEGTDCFIVDITVGAGNAIRVLLDKDSGTSITDCVAVSRHIEGNLDREEEDFELSVMSPGLDYPLSSERQYRKNIGREVKVTTQEGKVFKGELVVVDSKGILLTSRTKERIEGRKAKQWVDHEDRLEFNEIKETKIIISFK